MALFTSISICTGVGMLDHGVNIALGGTVRPILYVEREAFSAANLVWQMEKKFLPEAPIWNDVSNLRDYGVVAYIRAITDIRPLDLLIGGIPCQPWSVAGKRHGSGDGRDLWPSTHTAIVSFEPRIVFIENVPGILCHFDGTEKIINDLQKIGYRVTAGLFTSQEMGASHKRQRLFIMADRKSLRLGTQLFSNDREAEREINTSAYDCQDMADCESNHEWWPPVSAMRRQRQPIGRCGSITDADDCRDVAYNYSQGLSSGRLEKDELPPLERSCNTAESLHYAPGKDDYDKWRTIAEMDPTRMPCIESGIRGMANGMADRVDRLRSIGNGVDPLVAAYAFVTLWSCLQND